MKKVFDKTEQYNPDHRHGALSKAGSHPTAYVTGWGETNGRREKNTQT